MTAYILRRLLLAVPTIIVVTLIVFTLLRLLPGDIAMLILTGGNQGGSGAVDPTALAAMREQLGINKPIYVQYFDWVSGLARLDLGNSFYFRRPIIDDILRALPYTIELALLATLLKLFIAIPIGVISALKQDSFADYALRSGTIIGLSVPSFWLGLLIMISLVKGFEWIPPLRYVPFWVDPARNLSQMVWPALAIGITTSAIVARMTRSAMLEVLREDYIRTALSKGLAQGLIVTRHALKNAMLPVLTVIGLSFANLLGGSAVIEALFNVPGLGRLLVLSILGRDYPNVQAIVTFVAFAVIFTNLLVDVAYGWLDPRIRYR